jgi:hypothetical protein
MAAIGVAIRLIALFVMYMISNPSILGLKSPEEAKTLQMNNFTHRPNNRGQDNKGNNPALPESSQPMPSGRT